MSMLISLSRSTGVLVINAPKRKVSFNQFLRQARLVSTTLATRGGGDTRSTWDKVFKPPTEGTVYPDGTRNHPPTPDIRVPYGYISQVAPAFSEPLEWHYRKNEKPGGQPRAHMWAMLVNALMWYWVLFHVYYQWDHLVGHFDYPDSSKWTDKELGIPADDADDPELLSPQVLATHTPFVKPMQRSFMFYWYSDPEEDWRPAGPPARHYCMDYPVRCWLLNRCPNRYAGMMEQNDARKQKWIEENLVTGKEQAPTPISTYGTVDRVTGD